ncbi:MAG: hypothetical protein E7047_10415 [Lentisphaerae bacterium]|nr:hypothetical protein [Lentisphaerota bacterium]
MQIPTTRFFFDLHPAYIFDQATWGTAGQTPNHANGTTNMLALGGHVKSVPKPASKTAVGSSWNNRIILWLDEQ